MVIVTNVKQGVELAGGDQDAFSKEEHSKEVVIFKKDYFTTGMMVSVKTFDENHADLTAVIKGHVVEFLLIHNKDGDWEAHVK